jgi:hypothetical protein
MYDRILVERSNSLRSFVGGLIDLTSQPPVVLDLAAQPPVQGEIKNYLPVNFELWLPTETERRVTDSTGPIVALQHPVKSFLTAAFSKGCLFLFKGTVA